MRSGLYERRSMLEIFPQSLAKLFDVLVATLAAVDPWAGQQANKQKVAHQHRLARNATLIRIPFSIECEQLSVGSTLH